MRILLTGIACVGKTTIGRSLASRLGYRFFDLDEEVEKFYKLSIERLQKRLRSMEEFRRKCAAVLAVLGTQRCTDDFVIALPPRGLMVPYLRVVRQLDALTIALKDKSENVLERVVFYDIDSKPIDTRLSAVEKRLCLRDIKADAAYFARSYKKADLTVDLAGTDGIEGAVAAVERAVRARMETSSGTSGPIGAE